MSNRILQFPSLLVACIFASTAQAASYSILDLGAPAPDGRRQRDFPDPSLRTYIVAPTNHSITSSSSNPASQRSAGVL